MRELPPETWCTDDTLESCCRAAHPKRVGMITDILLWIECYASMVAVLMSKYPDKAPQFMCYLKSVIHASWNLEGTAWASYDAAYRRMAANCPSLDWGKLNAALYNQAFAGRAKVIPRCVYEAKSCHYAPTQEPPPSK